MKATAFILISALLVAALAVPLDIETFPDLEGPSILVDAPQITVNLIPHSHDDMGWLKTVDQYFYNAGKSITQDGVQYILDTVTRVLENDPTKKFVYVEIGFFERWWNEQSATVQATFTKLVQNKQLEFVNGGYVMNDEAAVYYEDCIEQMTLGHQFLVKTFNVTPTSGWHLDPFGHASAQSALFAQMGFTAFFVGRIDYQDKTLRKANQNMETVWIPNTSQGIENGLLAHVLFNRYSNPNGFCFDLLCGDDPIMDDPRLEGYNVVDKANSIAAWFRSMQPAYNGSVYLHTAGDDFLYTAAQVIFKNYDKLFYYMSNNANNYNITVNYSTPSVYLAAIAANNLTYSTKNDDFFPYADYVNAYWGGYFTSRVALKGLVRKQGQLLQATRRLVTQAAWQNTSAYLNANFATVDNALGLLEEALAIGQHHDAVTGTSKQAVAEDYKRYFGVGEDAVLKNVLNPIMVERAGADLNLTNLQFSTCQLNTSSTFCNVTFSSLTSNTTVLLAIYNSATARVATIRVKVPNGQVQVRNSAGTNYTADVICSNATDTTDCDLFFSDTLGAFTTAYYYLVPNATNTQVPGTNVTLNNNYPINGQQSITPNDLNKYTLQVCTDTTRKNCTTLGFILNYNYYESYQVDGQQKSGAYIFRPSNKTINGSIPYDGLTQATVYQGTNVLQFTLTGPKVIANLRIYSDLSRGVELQTFVNSIDVSDNQGKEIVLQVQVPTINNNLTCYTDSMGMELQKRVFNFRPTWPLNVSQPAAGNYYPVQSQIVISDINSNISLALVPDRAQGGGSLANGQVELMIHRRITNDDGRGVGEPLNETDWDGKGMRQWVTHTLVFNIPNYLTTSWRTVQLNRDAINLVLLSKVNATKFTDIVEDPIKDNFGNFDPAIKMICRPITLRQYLYRFQNTDEVNAKNVTNNVFTNLIYGAYTNVETSLTANQKKTDMLTKRYNWNNLGLNNPAFAKNDYASGTNFLLRPLEIRTFVVTFGSSEENKDDMEIITL